MELDGAIRDAQFSGDYLVTLTNSKMLQGFPALLALNQTGGCFLFRLICLAL